jgi:tetratricopeptide (TPR) repeat protein
LLVLDNLETPWEGAGPAIEARLAAIPGLAMLASFRGLEAVGGARWTLRQHLAPLPQPEARALFLDIAQSIPGDDPDLPALLDALGGVPLAICLTARRAAHRADLAGLWAEWQRTGTEIATWLGTTPGRLTSIPQSIALSLRSPRLNRDGYRLFAPLGQCPAGLAPPDRAALLGDAAFAAEDGLVAVGLAYHRGPRLDLLPPVRDYAKRQCPPTEADGARWCRYFLDRTRTEGGRIYGDGGAKALTGLTPEIANIDAALRAAPGLSLRELAVAALEGTWRLLSAGGAGSPAALDALARACAEAADAAGEAACHYWRGLVAEHRSDQDTARARYEEALPLYRRVGGVLGEANCINGLGDIALVRSDHDAARARYEEALPLYRRIGSVLGEANCIQSLGDIALRRSEHDTARALYEEALPLYRRVGDVVGEAICFAMLGRLARAITDHTAARTHFLAALSAFRHVGARQNEAVALEDLASVTVGPERDGYLQAARDIWIALNLPSGLR